MNDIKVSVSIVLPGSTLFTQEKAETLEKEQPNSGFETKSQVINTPIPNSKKDRKKLKGDKVKKTTISYTIRKCKTAKQVLKLNKETYLAMVSSSCPEWIKIQRWNTMNRNQRLEAHIQRIMEDLQGISYSYQILND